MGCVFCASRLKGVERNLTRGEIVEQVLRLRDLLPEGGRITNLVVMGMGESLANLDELIPALDRICAPEGLGLSQRRVTISTVGLPEKMRKLADLDRQYHLAVSLHAPTAALRDELVPITTRFKLHEAVEAAHDYAVATGRRVSIAYALIKDVNDRPEHAQALGRLLASRKAHANLIPYNPVPGLPFERPDPADVREFAAAVRRYGVATTVRKTKGRPIDAACGQLRRRVEAAEANA
jgi:23S rRNA (adenine2503-C2)-methyltransferase